MRSRAVIRCSSWVVSGVWNRRCNTWAESEGLGLSSGIWGQAPESSILHDLRTCACCSADSAREEEPKERPSRAIPLMNSCCTQKDQRGGRNAPMMNFHAVGTERGMQI